MTTSRNDFEAPDNPSSSIDSASAAPGAGDGGGNRSDSSTDQPAQSAQSATDRPGLLARAASALRPRRRVTSTRNAKSSASAGDGQDTGSGLTSGTTTSRLAATFRIPQSRAQRQRLRKRLSSLAAVLCVTALGTAAWLHEGVAQADLHLNDGGVWVTSTTNHLVARLNYPSREVDGTIRTSSSSFDVTQNAEDILVPDSGDASVSSVDPSQVSFSGRTQLTKGVTVAQGGDRAIAVDKVQGTIRASKAKAAGSLASAAPVVTGMPDVVAVVGKDGAIHAASATSKSLVSLEADDKGWKEATNTSLTLTSGTDLAITAVGDKPVVLERSTGILHLPEGKTVNLGAAGLALQQPGPEADSVLVASRNELISVPLNGGKVTKTPSAKEDPAPEGVAAQPVRLGKCVYAAWSGSGQFVRSCSGLFGGTDTIHDDKLASSSAPIFRVNRDAIVLNDLESGSVWLPNNDLVLIDDWTDKTAQTDDNANQKDDSANTSESQTPPERTEENHAPKAVDDSFGVRPGRSALLPVLANDSDPDGDVLTATPQDNGGSLAATKAQGGLALRMDIPDNATGSYSVPYTADDGRGMSDSAVATVDVHGWEVNAAPNQITTPTLTVAEGASGSLDVLGHWLDPDGDDLYLVSAQGEGMDVKVSNEGTVSVRELGAGTGSRDLTVTVSDGRETTSGVVKVDVQPAQSAKPIANADHVRVVAGTKAVVSPLDNDTSPSGGTLRLAAVQDAPAGTSIDIDQQAGVFTFSTEANAQAQTYYLTYDVMDGANTAQGIVRVDVTPKADATVPPEAENDTALLRNGGSTTIAPLNNDFDPSGGILVLQSVSTPPDSGVTVTVVDHSLLQITAASTVPANLTVDYTVTNGTSSTTGKVAIVPVTQSQPQPPVVTNDTAVVRAGDVVTAKVLDNDTSPSGLNLSVDSQVSLVGDELGTAWVSENTVRFRAGDQPGRTSYAYTAKDDQGQTASGVLTVEVRAQDTEHNSAPSPQNLEARTLAGSATNITVPLDGIDPDGDSVSLVGLNQAPSLGSVEVNSSWLTYKPAEGATGTDTFTYVVEDRFGAQSTGTVRVGVAQASPVNVAPVATDDLVVAKPGRTVAVDVLSNDLDTDGDTLSLEGDPVSSDPSLGVSTRAGRLVLNLPDKEGNHSVTYTVSDGRGGTDTGTVTVQVSSNAPLANPVGVDDYVTVDQVDANGKVTIPVLDNDKDTDGSPWDLKLSSSDPDVEVGKDSISLTVGETQRLVLYTITDADGLTGHAVVVVPARSALRPRINPSAVPAHVLADKTTDINLSSYILTREGTKPVIPDASSIHMAKGTKDAKITSSGTGLSFTPESGFTGQTSVTFTVADGTGSDALSATLTLPIVVDSSTNKPPTFTPTEVTVAPGEGAVTANLAAMTTDPDPSDKLSFQAGPAPKGFDISLSGSTLSVKAADKATEGTTGSVPITVSDGVNPPVSASLPVRVSASTKPLMTTAPINLESRNGEAVSTDVSAAVSNPFPDKPITLSGTPTITSGEGTVSASGTTVTITPNAGFHGTITAQYKVLDSTGSESRAVTGTITVQVGGVAPTAPSGLTVAPAGATSARVSWTDGSANGSPITGYKVSVDGVEQTCTTSNCLINNLVPGQTYNIQVVATNKYGDSSAASMSYQHNATAKTPAAPMLTAGAGSLIVRWSEVDDPFGGALSYDVRLSDGTVLTGLTGGSTSIDVAPGRAYTAQVRAKSSQGTVSDWSSPSNSVTPYGEPGTPGTPVITPNGETVAVSWQAANGNGSSVSYTLHYSNGNTSDSKSVGGATSTSVSLSPGTWTFWVVADNGHGSRTSAQASYTYKSTPLAPSTPVVKATGNSGELSVNASPRAGNGWSVGDLSVEYSVDQVNWTSSSTIRGLTDGQAYTVYARANGGGQYSDVVASSPVAPYGPPSAPSVSCELTGKKQKKVECSWTPGANNGAGTSYEQTENGGKTVDSIEVGETYGSKLKRGESRTWCVRAKNNAGTSEWGCDTVTRPPKQDDGDDDDDDDRGNVPVGTKQTFTIDYTQTCSPRGFGPWGRCYEMVVDLYGNPKSTLSCGYWYWDTWDWQPAWNEEEITLDKNGYARHKFPHRTPNWNESVTCTQQ
ncbi:putative bacteriochlorophyll 4-vinyl reductase [Actinomyces johnsonii F0542]|uniref:Putative bacteriochlorophyll 4-vinyl reductase n=1 Tax=Actinomyces johnsonii F0542 TaxID=1321818 RepID=U1RUU3_9ACTO|nr:Ig-like domain-containing protein [Actinomyces johnsonii]ERH23398.1 putative bacteriochlorophyll 4-vinyl reductase [Actinomyces johnsonii F0542]